jgi:hypothetical protein
VNQFIEVELQPIILTQEFVNGAFDHIKSIATFNTTRAEYTSQSGETVPGKSLTAGGGGLSIQSKHLCYLFETAFAAAIEPNMNVTQNPTCEWQLKWYGNQLE